MNPHDIKAALGKSGVKQVQIAKATRVSPAMVNAVIFSRAKSRKVALAISKATRIPLHQLWPTWYRSSDRAAA